MSGLTTHSYRPYKETEMVKEGGLLHGMGSDGKRQSKHFSQSSAIFRLYTRDLGLNRQRSGGRGRDICIIIK
jgi:hypothetical protein